MDCNSIVAVFSALDNYKFTIAAVGIDIDDEFSHASQVKVLKEIKTQIAKQDSDMPYIVISQTNEDFLSADDNIEDTLLHIVRSNVNFSQKHAITKD